MFVIALLLCLYHLLGCLFVVCLLLAVVSLVRCACSPIFLSHGICTFSLLSTCAHCIYCHQIDQIGFCAALVAIEHEAMEIMCLEWNEIIIDTLLTLYCIQAHTRLLY